MATEKHVTQKVGQQKADGKCNESSGREQSERRKQCEKKRGEGKEKGRATERQLNTTVRRGVDSDSNQHAAATSEHTQQVAEAITALPA